MDLHLEADDGEVVTDARLLEMIASNLLANAPEDQRRIFDRLYRVDGTRDRATGGSGLGLAIVHRAVQTLGGRIELDSTLGQGSQFRIVFPVASSPAKPTADSSPRPS